MPMGIVVMHWDERVGVEILAAYPEETTIQEKTLMQLYSQHEFTGEAGMVSLFAGAVNLASYYTGPETAIYVILLLTTEEDGDAYEEGLAEVAQQVLANQNEEALKTILPTLFQRLSVFPTLNTEQRYAMLYANEPKRMVLNRLREETVISKSEIAIWMKDTYREGFVDIDNLIGGMVKLGLVKIASVKDLSSDMLFLVEDLMILRVPPEELIKDPLGHHLPESLRSEYINEVRSFFAEYRPNDEDLIKIINEVILDPQVYEVLKLLREAMVTRNDIEKLRKKGVEDVDFVLKTLWENKMIAVFKDDKGVEYYCLVSDFFIDRFYPHYNLDRIVKQYQEKSQNKNTLIKALELMKEEYYAMLNAKKEAEKKKEESAATA